MRRTLALVAIAAMVLVLPHPVSADRQLGTLSHFANLPAGLLAEGLAIEEGHFYVGTISFASPDGTILAFDNSGSLTRTIIVPGLSAVGQVAFHDGLLFAVACTAFAPSATGAVVRVDLSSGAVAVVATESTCPNGLAIDAKGNMFVTNIFAGTVSEVTPSGAVSVFASGPLLAPALLSGTTFVVGPNDLAFDKKGAALYVTNVGQNSVVKVGITEDGTAGTISSFAVGIPTPDGLAFDQKGNLYVTSPFTNGIWLVARDGTANPLSLDTTHESLDNPSNVAFRGPHLYITNLALTTPTLVSKISLVTVEIPGIPV